MAKKRKIVPRGTITVLLLVLAIALILFHAPRAAGLHYIRAGASGANTGADWTNAWTSFGSVTWVRGDIYYVAAGSYGSVTFNQADSGSLVIEIRAAVGGAGDHGTNTGWSDGFQGQAQFSGSILSTDYYTLNGQVVPGCTYPSSSSSCYLLKFNNTSTADTSSAIRMNNANVNISLAFVEAQGSNVHTDGAADEGIYCAPGPCPNFYLGHSWVHNTGCDTLSFNWGTGSNGLFENNWISYNNFGPTTGAHCQGIQSTIGTMVLRYNVWQDIQSSAAISLAAGGAGAPITEWDVYGNIFMWDPTWIASVRGDGRVGYDDGIVGIFDEPI